MNIGVGLKKIRVWQLVYPIMYGVGTFGLQILEFCTLSSEIKYKQHELCQCRFIISHGRIRAK